MTTLQANKCKDGNFEILGHPVVSPESWHFRTIPSLTAIRK
jgi:hypothetical protein